MEYVIAGARAATGADVSLLIDVDAAPTGAGARLFQGGPVSDNGAPHGTRTKTVMVSLFVLLSSVLSAYASGQSAPQPTVLDLRKVSTVQCRDALANASALLTSLESADEDTAKKVKFAASQKAQNDPAIRSLHAAADRLGNGRLHEPEEPALLSPRGEFETHAEYARREQQYAQEQLRLMQEQQHVRAVNVEIDKQLVENQLALGREMDRVMKEAQRELAGPPRIYLIMLPCELGTFNIDQLVFPVWPASTTFFNQEGSMEQVKAPWNSRLEAGPAVVSSSFYYLPKNAHISITAQGDGWRKAEGIEIAGFANAQEAKRFKEAAEADPAIYYLLRTTCQPKIQFIHTAPTQGSEDMVAWIGIATFPRHTDGNPEGFAYNIELDRVDDVRLGGKAVDLFPRITLQPAIAAIPPAPDRLRSIVTQDYAQAMLRYRKAAEAGNSEAMSNIGVLYEKGLGVSQDHAQAMTWLLKAAEAGNSDAMENMGVLYGKGPGVAQDYAQAMTWFRKAAEAGNSEAMSNIGVLYENGLGVSQDYSQAMTWFRKAAEAGSSVGMGDIGLVYENGWGVAQDYVQAMAWYRKAAGAGNSDAIYNIGCLYYLGQGVAKDLVQARSWFEKAAQAGHEGAKKWWAEHPEN